MAALREAEATNEPLIFIEDYWGREWDLTLLFDEDGCRDWLNEMGKIVVNQYGFAMGMEETYSCMYHRYGPEGTGDAISLLHEILEETDVIGAGLGLDTDIWHPWKKAFRLRNVGRKPSIRQMLTEPDESSHALAASRWPESAPTSDPAPDSQNSR
jgi:hypothetical protein